MGCDCLVSEDLAASFFGMKMIWYTTTTLHGVTTQKTSTWIFPVVITSNITEPFI